MDKETWRKFWLQSINELTSITLQKNWLLNDENLHNSYVEFICCYFDDLFLHDDYQEAIKRDYLSEIEFEIIKNWHFLLKSYKSPKNIDFNDKLILEDNNWINIVDIGKKVKMQLLNIIDESEKNYLVEE